MPNLSEALFPHATTRSYKKGAMVLYQSEIPREAFIVKKGFVRAYTITSSGDERTIALHTRGDLFPLSWLYGKTKNTLFYYEAGATTELACLSKDQIMDVVGASSDLTTQLLRLAVNDHTALLMRITALEQSNATEKVTLTMYYLLIRHGVERRPGLFTVDLKLTQSMIASMVGITRESTALIITKLKDDQVVTYSNFTYVIDRARLEKLIADDSFKDVSLR